MKKATILTLTLTLGLLLAYGTLYAQDPAETVDDADAPAPEQLAYDDYTVKGYSLTFFGGHFSGGTYLDLPLLGPKTFYTEGAGDILRYFPTDDDGFGTSLPVSTSKYLFPDGTFIYDAARKEIETSTAFGGRIGIYISDDFHIDMLGTYSEGKVVTTMVHRYEQDDASKNVREVVDEDPGFKMLKGGLALQYDASPAKFLGVTPRLGFGLGGIINRFSELEDKTALYLEGNFALNYGLMKNVDLTAQVDATIFSFKVDELGYSNMLTYQTYSLGLCWFMDVLPAPIRAAHEAEED